ncbi:hypothetical protein [Bradyrhizobium roseum]|uniref:hypothetical protein n=1 Tax=Bradyrhizobium roseum TaxID=3056648 RepID=UPI0026061ED7|nr:hypothetical protein [Bradyrhizobium roseus]WKA26191.1 hypothetical protein QUH67_21530 [Bradyrhizobium roseus]
MGEVVQFGKLENQRRAGSTVAPHQYLATEAGSVPSLKRARNALERDVAIVVAIAISTEDPDVREKTLKLLNGIEKKLVHLSVELLKAKAASIII